MTYNGPIKCTYQLAEKQKPGVDDVIKIGLEYENGDAVSENEVDIGQEEWGFYIPHTDPYLLWKLENYSPDIPSQYWQKRCFATMFRSIGLLIPQKYRSVTFNDTTAFFNIRFTHDMDVFGGREGVLAHAYLFHPNNSAKYNGLMEWNDNHAFTPFGDALPAYLLDDVNYTEGEKHANGNLKTLRTQPLLSIGMHELDHNHGLRHDLNSTESLMFPFVKSGTVAYSTPTEVVNIIVKGAFMRTADDMKRYEQFYGRRKLSISRFNQMRSRRVRARKVDNVPYWVAV